MFKFHLAAALAVLTLTLAPVPLQAAFPGLQFSSFLGGNGDDAVLGTALDDQNNLYLAGYTRSGDFPNAPCSLDCTLGTGADAFLVKLDPTGTQILFMTFLGGNGDDFANGVALDAAGNIYVAGQTGSTDFPTVAANQGDQTGIDGFVSKISPDGTTLLYSTYVGGSNLDLVRALAVDGAGNAYVTGWTNSAASFPLLNAFDTTFNGGAVDAFAVKLDTAGALVYGTYLGGAGADYGVGVAVDASGNAFVGGQTTSADYPTTLGAFQTAIDTGVDATLTEFSPTGTLLYSTYIGGNGEDSIQAVVASATNEATVVGYTDSTDFPTAAPIQGMIDGVADGFVAVLPDDGSLPFATYLGGGGYELPSQLARAADGTIYVVGFTDSTDYPGVTADSVMASLDGTSDSFLAIIDPAQSLAYATYLGGDADESIYGVAVDADGYVYVGGQTSSTVYPTRAAFDADANGGVGDAFFAKLDLFPPTVVEVFPADTATDVPVGVVLFVRFSEDMDPANFDANSVALTDGVNPVTGTWTYDAPTRRYFFTPDAPLANGTLYTATLATTPTDLAQNPVATQAWSFTTEPVAPTTTGGTTTGGTTGDATAGGGTTGDDGGDGTGGDGGTAPGATPALPLTYVLGGQSCALIRDGR